jgi:hypothetical protein
MGVVKSATGGYALGFILLAGVALGCLGVLATLDRPRPQHDLDAFRVVPAAGQRG